MDTTLKKFKKHLLEQFGGEYVVATWETIPSTDKHRDEVIHVGLAKAEITLKEARKLPGEIDGVKIVYSYVGPIEVLTKKRYDPLIGGVSFGAIDITAGTFGGVVYENKTDKPYFLTNEHVVSDTSNTDPAHPPIGHPILQPGPIDGGNPLTDIAGPLAKVGGMKLNALQGKPSNIDAALVEAKRNANPDEFFGLGYIECLKHVTAKVGDYIAKSGRTTKVTYNTVAGVDVSANIGGMAWSNPVVMEGLIQSRSAFVEGGDSGSRVWKIDTMEPIGIVFAGSFLTSLMIPAQTICDKFDVYFGYREPEDIPVAPEEPTWWGKIVNFFRNLWRKLTRPITGRLLC